MKILSLDGGGVFGFAQAKILQESGCWDKFDCYAGTSIGSALSTAMALGRGPLGQGYFDEWMPKIFKSSFLRDINIFLPKYSDKGLNMALQSVFGGDLFGTASKPVFVTSVNVPAKQLKVFYSGDTVDQNTQAWQIVRCATAAETYFSTCNGYADGGIFANNPAMISIAAASKRLNVPLDEMEILSIGTGEKQDSNGIPHWRIGWGLWLIEAMLEGSANAMHAYFASCLPVKKIKRISFVRQPDWEMDDPKSMRQAEIAWREDIDKAVQIVRDF